MVLFSGDCGGNDCSCFFRSALCKCHPPPIFTGAKPAAKLAAKSADGSFKSETILQEILDTACLDA